MLPIRFFVLITVLGLIFSRLSVFCQACKTQQCSEERNDARFIGEPEMICGMIQRQCIPDSRQETYKHERKNGLHRFLRFRFYPSDIFQDNVSRKTYRKYCDRRPEKREIILSLT